MRTSLLRVITTVNLGVYDIGLGSLLKAFLYAASNLKTIMRKQGEEFWGVSCTIIAVQLHLSSLTFSRLKSLIATSPP
jgi:hypothetical protein